MEQINTPGEPEITSVGEHLSLRTEQYLSWKTGELENIILHYT